MDRVNETEAQIFAQIEELKGDLYGNYAQICRKLANLRPGIHYMHKDHAWKYYKEVAAQKLFPESVFTFGTKRGYLECMMGRARDVQLRVAAGAEFDWCQVERGEIVDRRTSWKKMGAADFKRLFPAGQPVRSLTEQRAILQAEIAARPVTHIRRQPVACVDLVAGTFTLGGVTAPLSVVLGALADGGVDLRQAAA